MRTATLLFVLFAALFAQSPALQLRGRNGILAETELSLSSFSGSCPAMKNSEQVRSLLAESSGHWAQCQRDIEPSRQFAEEVNDKFSSVLKAIKSVESLTSNTANAAQKVERVAKTHLAKLKAIPKVGKVVKLLIEVIDEAEDILQQTNERVEDARKVVERFEKASFVVSATMDKISKETGSVSTNFNKAAQVQATIIACSQKTSTCVDDTNAEKVNTLVLGTVRAAESVSEICPKTFSGIRRVFETLRNLLKVNVFDTLRRIVDKVRRALDPVLKRVNDIIREVGKHLSEAYCCVTPLIGQIAFKGISQVLDLATCPVDSLSNGLEAVLKELTNYVNSAVLSFIRKALSSLPDVTYKFPTIFPGEVNPTTCTFKQPAITLKSESLTRPLISAVGSSGVPSLRPVATAFGNIGQNIKNDCREALSEIGKNLGKDCCKAFRPLRDGQFCDPTNTVPFKHCSQCSSGKFSFHVKKVHVACGVDNTIKDAAKKVGSTIKTGVKKTGKALKKVGRGIKKFFG